MAITIPNTFSPNTTAVSADVNENFTEVADKAVDKTGDTLTGTLNTQHLLSATDATYDLGSASKQYRNLYLSGTITGPAASNAFGTVAVSGQSDVVADQTHDTLTLVAGTGMTLTTSAGGDSVTFAASAGVTGPGSSTNTAIARWNGTGGAALLNSSPTIDTNGLITTPAGTGTGTVRVAGTLLQSVTAVGNVGAGEDDLISFTIPANTLISTGDRLMGEFAGTFAANGNAKRLKVKFGATTVLDTGSGNLPNGVGWRIRFTITRTGAATQNVSGDSLWGISVAQQGNAAFTTATETLSGTVVLKITGEATSDNDVIAKEAVVTLWPA